MYNYGAVLVSNQSGKARYDSDTDLAVTNQSLAFVLELEGGIARPQSTKKKD